jgi:hypothetical protein
MKLSLISRIGNTRYLYLENPSYASIGEGVKILNANYGTYFGYFLITKLFDDTISTSVPFRYDATGEGVKILNANYGTYFGYFLITKLFDDTLSVKVHIVISICLDHQRYLYT